MFSCYIFAANKVKNVCIMKKVISLMVLALAFAAVSCGNNGEKKAAEAETEAVVFTAAESAEACETCEACEKADSTACNGEHNCENCDHAAETAEVAE